MDIRRKKQFIVVLAIFVLPFLFVGVRFGPSLYRQFFPLPSLSPPEAPFELLWTKAFPGEKEFGAPGFVYDVASRMRNKNDTEAIQRLQYRFELLGAGGAVLATRSGGSYLRRGEAKYVVENSLASVQPAQRVKFSVTESVLVEDKEADASPVLLRSREYSGGLLKGVAINETAVGFERVNVAALLFNEAGEPIRARATTFTRFLPREERGFELKWSEPGPAVSQELELSTNIFDSANYLPEERGDLKQ